MVMRIDDHGGSRGMRNRPAIRKERRKAARVQKKAKVLPSRKKIFKQQASHHMNETMKNGEPPSSTSLSDFKPTSEQSYVPKSILKKPNTQPVPNSNFGQLTSLSPSPSLPPKLSQATKDRLSADDAEIAALEKALGLKGTGSLPGSFAKDGLDILLDGIEGSFEEGGALKAKRKRTEEEDWLERKRRKSRGEETSELEAEVGIFHSKGEKGSRDVRNIDDDLTSSEEDHGADSFGFSSEQSSSPEPQNPKPRENPYKAPIVTSNSAVSSKYIPPSLRAEDTSLTQDLSSLRRQLQGLLNRLSEANLLSVLGDVERLYRSNARQHVSVTLLDLLMGLLCDPTSLQDTFIILHAGFIAAVYKIIGTEFGALTVQRIDKEFIKYYSSEVNVGSTGKRSANLISLLSELYNFQVVGSNLIYDFIQIFLGDLSETSAELVLKIMRSKYSFLVTKDHDRTLVHNRFFRFRYSTTPRRCFFA